MTGYEIWHHIVKVIELLGDETSARGDSQTLAEVRARLAGLRDQVAHVHSDSFGLVDPMPTITPDPPEFDAAELRRWAVEQAVKMAAASMRDGRGSLVVADVADKFIAYVIGEQTPREEYRS